VLEVETNKLLNRFIFLIPLSVGKTSVPQSSFLEKNVQISNIFHIIKSQTDLTLFTF
jgi:hypothetical protein